MRDDVRVGLARLMRRRLCEPAFGLSIVPALLGVVVCSTRTAGAQQPKFDGEFTVQRFDPAPGPRNFFVTRTARSDGKNTWSAGLVFDYAHNPFTVQSCLTSSDCSAPNSQLSDIHVVETLATAHLLGSYTPKPYLQLGLSLPVTYVKGQGIDRANVSAVQGGTSAVAVGDPALEGKFRFLGKVDTPLAAAAAAFVTIPTASAMANDKYIGDGSFTGGLRAIGDVQLRSLSFAGNLIGVIRKSALVGDAKIGSELRYSVAAGYQLRPVFRVVVETFANSRLVFKSNGTSAMEALLGAQVTPMSSPLMFSAGLGTGIINGVGAPGFRGFVGAMYVHESHD